MKSKKIVLIIFTILSLFKRLKFLKKEYCDSYYCFDSSNVKNNTISTLDKIVCAERHIFTLVNKTQFPYGNFHYAITTCPEGFYCEYALNKFEILNLNTNSSTVPRFSLEKPVYYCLNKTEYELQKENINKKLKVINEECEETSDCQVGLECNITKSTTTNITSGKCVNSNEFCTYHSQCEVGSACFIESTGEGKCSKQIGEDSLCANDYECENNLGCFNRTCTRYYKFDNGEILTSVEDSKFCKSAISNYINETTIVCDQQKRISKHKCEELQDVCEYEWNQSGRTKLDCQCYPSNDSQRYCPPASKSIRHVILSGVHTLNRFKKEAIESDLEEYYDKCVVEALFSFDKYLKSFTLIFFIVSITILFL